MLITVKMRRHQTHSRTLAQVNAMEMLLFLIDSYEADETKSLKRSHEGYCPHGERPNENVDVIQW